MAKTARWKRRTRKVVVQDAAFGGCTLSLGNEVDFKRYPVSLEFTIDPGAEFSRRETVLFQMEMKEAERVHKALGEMIVVRKDQLARKVFGG